MKPRTISQTGFLRIPKNPGQRSFGAGGVPIKRNAIDALNEKLAAEDKTLHPTKGFRLISAKRSVAQLILAEVKSGQRTFNSASIGAQIRAASSA